MKNRSKIKTAGGTNEIAFEYNAYGVRVWIDNTPIGYVTTDDQLAPNIIRTSNADDVASIIADLKNHWNDINDQRMIRYSNGANMYTGLVIKYSDTVGGILLLGANGKLIVYNRSTNTIANII